MCLTLVRFRSELCPCEAKPTEIPGPTCALTRQMIGKRAASASQCSSEGEKKTKQQKKGKVWDQPNEVNKVTRSLIAKLDKVREMADGVAEEIASFEKLSEEDKAVIKRNLDVLKQRGPLLKAWLWTASDDVVLNDFAKDLPVLWKVPGSRAASWAETCAATTTARAAIHKATNNGTTDLADTWPDVFTKVMSDLKATAPFSSDAHPDHATCNQFVAKVTDVDGKPVSEVDEFTTDLVQLHKTTVSRVLWLTTVETFIGSKATLPVADLVDVATVTMVRSEFGVFRVAASEHELKDLDKRMKEVIDKAKDFVQSIKSTVKTASAALKTNQTDQMKKVKSADKDRDLEEKKKLALAKKEMKDIKSMCKDNVSPGLLSYCGPMMMEVPKYVDIEKFKQEAARVNTTIPYLIESCSSLTALAAEPVVNTAFLNFRAQLPRCESSKSKKKAQCPFSIPTSCEKVRSAMLELSPPSRITMSPVPTLSMWGGQQDLLQGGFEFQCLGNLRFTSKGTREIAVTKFTELYEVMKELAAMQGKPLPDYSSNNTVADHVERIMLHDMSVEGLKLAVDKGMKAYRFTAGPGSMVFIPAGYVAVERAIGTEGCTGFRLHIIENENVLNAVAPVEAILKSYSTVDQQPVLKAFADVKASLVKAGKLAATPVQAVKAEKP